MSTSPFTDPESRPPPRKRQRARKACLPCRQRKRKCDVQYPCSMCTTYGYTCQYPQDDGPTAAFVDRGQSRAGPVTEGPVPATNGSTLDSQTPESHVSPGDQGFLDPVKARYMGMHSVMAFPRTLGLDFQSANPPRLHSFAWNCGIRPEEEGPDHGDLRDLITFEDFNRYSEIYFDTVHPVFGVLEREPFLNSVNTFWTAANGPSGLEAIIAGVVALGSFFSANLGHSKESEIVQHAKGILEDSTANTSVDHVCAWILRTLYLRSITRPHRAWIASCMTMHLAEATGLHHEIDSVVLTTTHTKTVQGSHSACPQARKVFWVAWLTNSMISYEYGRSSATLNSITTKMPPSLPNDFTSDLIRVGQCIPNLAGQDRTFDFEGIMAKLQLIPDGHPFISLSKADLCMSVYRHSRLLKMTVSKDCVLQIIKIGNTAVEAAHKLAQQHRYWWNVLCTVFQYVCVLLAIDTAESLAHVSIAMGTLDNIAGLLGTHMGNEAANTAKLLLRDSMKKKRQEISLMEAADTGNEQDIANGIQLLNSDLDWDTLLDPWYMSNFPILSGDFPMGDGAVVGMPNGTF